MDWGDVVGVLGGAGGVAVIGFARDMWRGRRAARNSDAKVVIAEISADQAALQILVGQIAELREECRRLRTEIEAVREAGEECERGRAALQRQINRMRSWMRTDPSEREDMTPAETPATKGRTGT